VTTIKGKMREVRLRWFGLIRRRSMDAPVRRCERIVLLECRTGRGSLRRVGTK